MFRVQVLFPDSGHDALALEMVRAAHARNEMQYNDFLMSKVTDEYQNLLCDVLFEACRARLRALRDYAEKHQTASQALPEWLASFPVELLRENAPAPANIAKENGKYSKLELQRLVDCTQRVAEKTIAVVEGSMYAVRTSVRPPEWRQCHKVIEYCTAGRKMLQS